MSLVLSAKVSTSSVLCLRAVLRAEETIQRLRPHQGVHRVQAAIVVLAIKKPVRALNGRILL